MIDDVILAFSKELLRKFHMKEATGWTGWNDPANMEQLKEQLYAHVTGKELTSDNLIDIALFCLFLWNSKRFLVMSMDGRDITDRVGKMTKKEAKAAGINYYMHPYMLDPEETKDD